MKLNHKLFLLLFIVINLSCKKETEKNEAVNKKQLTNKITLDLLPNIMSNKGIDIVLNEISKTEYDRLKNSNRNELVLFSNSDSIENILEKRHENLFKKNEGKFIFKTENRGEVTLFNNLVQDKTYSKYEVKARFNDYVILNYNLYEGWYVVLVNVKTNKSYVLPGKPNFINDHIFYDHSNYYGEEELVMIDVKKEEYLTLTFDDVLITNSYNFNHCIRFEVQDFGLSTTKHFQIINYKTPTY